jgi:HD-GYP domain-containing protein (c-di-GMP phosphodiesterase class II)
MSSDPQSDAPSSTPETGIQPGRADIVATLGATLIDALEQHLPGTRQHADATGAYAFAAAAELGLGRDRSELVREAARLHDVGMVYVPANLLRRPVHEHDAADRALLASHIEAGSRLGRGAGLPEDVCAWMLATRERWDGGGPAGLASESIPIEARIIRVACAADLMLAGNGALGTVAGLRAAGSSELDPGVVEVVAGVLERVATG